MRYYLASLILFSLSCSFSLLNEMARPSVGPRVSELKVLSFNMENRVILSWNKDEGADLYVLYRSSDGSTFSFNEIYRGLDLEYIDRSGGDGDIFHYSLAKIRGKKEYEQSKIVTGIFSSFIDDRYENNDEKDSGTPLLGDADANLYTFESLGGQRFVDHDWYLLRLPPRRRATIIIRQLEPAPGVDTLLLLYREGEGMIPVVNNDEVILNNYTYKERDYPIRIDPREDMLLSQSANKGAIVTYRIMVKQIVSLAELP